MCQACGRHWPRTACLFRHCKIANIFVGLDPYSVMLLVLESFECLYIVVSELSVTTCQQAVDSCADLDLLVYWRLVQILMEDSNWFICPVCHARLARIFCMSTTSSASPLISLVHIPKVAPVILVWERRGRNKNGSQRIRLCGNVRLTVTDVLDIIWT